MARAERGARHCCRPPGPAQASSDPRRSSPAPRTQITTTSGGGHAQPWAPACSEHYPLPRATNTRWPREVLGVRPPSKRHTTDTTHSTGTSVATHTHTNTRTHTRADARLPQRSYTPHRRHGHVPSGNPLRRRGLPPACAVLASASSGPPWRWRPSQHPCLRCPRPCPWPYSCSCSFCHPPRRLDPWADPWCLSQPVLSPTPRPACVGGTREG